MHYKNHFSFLFFAVLAIFLTGCVAVTPLDNETQVPKIRDLSEYNTIWERIGAQLTIDTKLSETRVQHRIKWYLKHNKELHIATQRARPYLYFIVKEIEKRNLPIELSLLPLIESSFKTKAYSSMGAAGLWQFIASTGRNNNLLINAEYDGRLDVLYATHSALGYIEKLYSRFNKDLFLTLAAYNAGPLRIERAISNNVKYGYPTDYWHLKLPRETRYYIPKLLATIEIIKNPKLYNIQLDQIPNIEVISPVAVKRRLALKDVARIIKIEEKYLLSLNAGCKFGITPNTKTYSLAIPTNKVENFRQNLASFPTARPLDFYKHIVRRGDTLSGIAKTYMTSVSMLKEANNINSYLIFPKQVLTIPLKRATPATEKKEPGIHIVQKGDTFWGIAISNKTTIQRIMELNDLHNNHVLQPGQKIIVQSTQIEL
jgi:membrane-bound lytic murein transglycosylase D